MQIQSMCDGAAHTAHARSCLATTLQQQQQQQRTGDEPDRSAPALFALSQARRPIGMRLQMAAMPRHALALGRGTSPLLLQRERAREYDDQTWPRQPPC